jgi:quinoprotein glucose dehydrogenase
VEVKTGKRVWHQQLVHHDIWDYDPPSAPILADITVDGRPIKAVVQLTKMAFAYVFDRTNGNPVWPIEERAVPQSDVPGEHTSATQRFPTKPPAFDRQGMSANDLIDFTPQIKELALKAIEGYRLGPLFTPPSLVDSAKGTKGTLTFPVPAERTGKAGHSIPIQDSSTLLLRHERTRPSMAWHGPSPAKQTCP